ncbi:MAG TPA: hypothetical protein VF145_00360 [Chitinophagaceae bacterium]
MKKTTMVFGWLAVSLTAPAQKTNPIDSILGEGLALYRLETASWLATETFLTKYRDQRGNIGGYFSYEMNNRVQCVFFSKAEEPVVIAAISFDTSLNPGTIVAYSYKRAFTNHERRLYTIRRNALEQINSDTFFARYEHTSFNLVPVADSSCGKVYILTEPEVDGVVIFGNDYLLQYSKRDSLLARRALHSGIIPVNFGKETDPELIQTFHFHSREAGTFISPTDICTLMLFRRFARWKLHTVMSKTHVSEWDLESGKLTIHTRGEWSKLNSNKAFVGGEF